MLIQKYPYWQSIPHGYREFYKPCNKAERWVAPWWCAWFFSVLIDFAWHMDRTAVEMRLDAPDFIRTHEGEVIEAPWSSLILGWLE